MKMFLFAGPGEGYCPDCPGDPGDPPCDGG